MLKNIEAERVRHNLTREQISKKIGVVPRTYYNWINEETDIPSTALVKMSRIFNSSVDYLLEDTTK